MSKRNPQIEMLKKAPKAFGGELFKKRAGRLNPRPLTTQTTMHLVLRSGKAVNDWSFKKHDGKIRFIVNKFALKYGIKILSLANVGNHLHFQLKLGNRYTYKPFIRAITAAIMMAVTGVNKWTKKSREKLKFWDYRPYTRAVALGRRSFLNLRDYLRINQLEGFGVPRAEAVFIVKKWESLREGGSGN